MEDKVESNAGPADNGAPSRVAKSGVSLQKRANSECETTSDRGI